MQNDVLVQFMIPGLPFGGTGQAGYGNYHGRRCVVAFLFGFADPSSRAVERQVQPRARRADSGRRARAPSRPRSNTQ